MTQLLLPYLPPGREQISKVEAEMSESSFRTPQWGESGPRIPIPGTGLSTVTSALAWMDGHKKRLDFLKYLQGSVDFDRFGRGVKDLEDKWDGLAPYRYSVAFENCSSSHYWTKKLIECGWMLRSKIEQVLKRPIVELTS